MGGESGGMWVGIAVCGCDSWMCESGIILTQHNSGAGVAEAKARLGMGGWETGLLPAQKLQNCIS